MILSDKLILEAIEKGDIVITPFERSRVGTNSVDLTLGNILKIYTNFTQASTSGQIQPWNSAVDASAALDVKFENKMVDIDISGEDGYILQPGILYLASTAEWTETRNYVPELKGKSSMARLGLSIDQTASFGDNGFCGNWTLEITVIHPLKVYAGQKIAQIFYTTTGETLVPYDQKPDAKYSGQTGTTESKMHKNF